MPPLRILPTSSILVCRLGWWLCFTVLVGSMTGCRAYRNRILFATDGADLSAPLTAAMNDADRNYTIQEDDYLEIEVYTNRGELLIDPNFEIMKEIGVNGQNNQMREEPRYLVREGGLVALPVVGDVALAGLTLNQADSLLAQRYATIYEAPFIVTRYINKRVFVLGGAVGQVVPLLNENMNLIEVLALAGGVAPLSRTDNIRLIRGDLSNPEVQVIDLSTVAGMRAASLRVRSGDIIYVQPVQRVVAEAVRDISPILSVVTSIFALIVLVGRL